MGVVLLLVSNVIFFILWITGAHPPAGTIGAVAGAAVSGVVAVALAVVASIDRQRDRQERERVMTEEHLVHSFQYFTGGSGGQQKRSVGISAVEGFSKEVPRLRGVFVPLLVNQVIYVLTKIPEGPRDEALDNHEKDNLERMIDLLNQFRSSGDFAKYYARRFESVRGALRKRRTSALSRSAQLAPSRTCPGCGAVYGAFALGRPSTHTHSRARTHRCPFCVGACSPDPPA